MKKCVFASIILLTAAIALTGCEMQIFEDKNAKYQLKEAKRGNLEDNTYYVKDGTDFFKIYDCARNSTSNSFDISKCAWVTVDEDMIPTYYSNELLAKASSKIETDALVLERYKDTGFSIGVYGAVYNNGYITFEYNSCTIKNTDAKEAFNTSASTHISIETINGRQVTEDMVNEAGVILGMEEDMDYEISFYAGTYYGTAIVKADTHFFQCYEPYKINDFVMTKNGYEAIYLPEDLKSGYYELNGEGIFRYIDSVKGTVDLSEVDYNEPYYESEEDQMAVFSQQFTFQLEAITENMSVEATFDPYSVNTQDNMVRMLVTAPDGTRMLTETASDTGKISCDMAKSVPGKWTVNITPQSMKIYDVQIVSNESAMEATEDNYTLSFEQDMTGVVIVMEYEGDGIVTAQIVDKDNQSYNMIQETKGGNKAKKQMQYTFAYLPAGDYKIKVYHYPDTKVVDVSYYLSEDVRDIDIITVEE